MSKKGSNPPPPNCQRPAPPPAPPRKPSLSSWQTASIIIALCAERDVVRASRCTCSGFVLQYEGGCQCGRKKRIDKLTAKIEKLLFPHDNPVCIDPDKEKAAMKTAEENGQATPPRKPDPDTWGMGGYPGGLSAPISPLNTGPSPTPKESAEKLAAALKGSEASLLIEAANIIESNAAALRESSTVPGTDNWPDERDRNEYVRDMDVVLQLRLLAKHSKPDLNTDAKRLNALQVQLIRAHHHLLASSDEYDKGCMTLKNVLDNWQDQWSLRNE